MAEFGCITNTREWGEIAALYSENMTAVYSGGLAYEYTVEPNGYGLVEVVDGEITPNADFTRLVEAYAATPNPSGDGGYSATTTASECPAGSDDWAVPNDLLPSMPQGAETYMENGAGTGPGLGDDVTPSQYGGDTYSESMIEMDGSVPTGTNAATSNGTSSGSSSSASGNAGVVIRAPGTLPFIPIVVSVLGVAAGMGLIL